jgi:hypothetical protein
MMQRNLFLVLLLAAFGFSCTTTEHSMMTDGPPTQPTPAPEMAHLQRMIGNWTTTGEMVSPAPETGMPNTFTGGGTWTWALNGMYVKATGWHEMPGGMRMNNEEFITWDEDAGKFHAWYYSDWGERGESFWTMSDDGMTFDIKATAVQGGKRSRGTGTLTFVNDMTMNWTWTEKSSEGKMVMRGTSHKR